MNIDRLGQSGIGDDPARNGFRVRDLQIPGGVDETRFAKRRKLLATQTGPQNLPVERGRKLDTLRDVLAGAIGGLDAGLVPNDLIGELDIDGLKEF